MDLLFFSRGRGRGHAVPDMAIMEAVHSIDSNIYWRFVSYGTGASTLSEFGYAVVDLQFPDENPFLETIIASFKVINELSPRVVISHEEFAAVLAAKIHGTPAIFLTDWFENENRIAMQVLAYAELVIFLGERGVFDEPTFLKNKVIYVGTFVRDFKYHIGDRERARREMGIGNDLTVVSMLPGGWTEQRAPVFDLLVPAFLRLERSKKLLCWVAGEDFSALRDRAKGMPDVLVLKKHWPFEQLIVATDLVITKGNRVTIMEAARLGVPSISLSHGLNPAEDFIVPRIKSNLALRVKGINVEFLSRCLEDVLNSKISEEETLRRAPGVGSVAEVLLGAISKLGHLGANPEKESRTLGALVRTDVSRNTEPPPTVRGGLMAALLDKVRRSWDAHHRGGRSG